MKEFFTSISSLYWWISVVIVGILINIISAYLKIRLDRYLFGVSGWWRKRSELKKAERNRYIKKLRSDPQEQVLLALYELRLRIRSVGLVTMGFIFISMGLIHIVIVIVVLADTRVFPLGLGFFLNVLGTIAILAGLNDHGLAVYKQRLLFEARNTQEKRDGL